MHNEGTSLSLMPAKIVWLSNRFKNIKWVFLKNIRTYGVKIDDSTNVICNMKYLNVAEKNDAAKTIAGYLSRGTCRRREGLSPYNKIYEFETTVFGQNSKMIMTSVSGHLLNYAFVGSFKIWQSCNPISLFEAPVLKSCPEDYQKIKLTLEREIRSCQSLIIWTDCDREGENIGFEIIQVCKEIKSNIKIYRAKFSEITSTSVNRALQTLGNPDKNISDAVDVRQELDLRIGAAFTRFQTLRLQKVFPQQLSNSLISYGSCQFPTLGFVVERYKAVENFVSESFWKIAVTHVLNDLKVDFSWKRVRVFDEQTCMVIHDVCTENPVATVINVQSKPKSKWRPLPLDTVEMEKLASRKLHINAKEVMQIAEKLYTKGIISYPRTETNIYPNELNLTNLINLHTADREWGSFAQRILDTGGPTPRQGKKSDQAHPPIHPTKHIDNLTGNEKKVYDLIVRSFLACCFKDAQGQETTVEINIAGEKFAANGLMIIARNYLDVYPFDRWSAKEIHIYQEGQTFLPTSMDIVAGQTSAPALLTEADLIALMEKHGIGTDATHADHIETIKNRSYVALGDNIHFVPGLLGMGLVDGYDSMGLSFSKPFLRANLESDLKEICAGRKVPQTVLAQQISAYRDVYTKITQEAEKIDQALSERFNQPPSEQVNTDVNTNVSVMKCKKCNSDMTLRSKKDNSGFFVSCMGFPNCKNAIWLPSIVNKVIPTDQPCSICGPGFKKLEFHWKNRSIEHLYPSPYVTCLGGCDPHILQTLNINSHSSIINSSSSRSTESSYRSISMESSQNSNNSSRNNVPTNRNNKTGNSMTNWLSTNNVNSTTVLYPNNLSNTPNQSNEIINNRNTNTNSQLNNPSIPHQSDDNHVVCNCGDAALLLTVRKASANTGRQFYKCSKPKENGGCDFFLWATSSESSNNIETQYNDNNIRGNTSNWNNTNYQSSSSSSSYNRGDQNAWNSNSDNIPNCKCNLPSKIITVHKEGPNKGRAFYGCSKSITDRCNFFQWANDQTNIDTEQTSRGSYQNRKRPNSKTSMQNHGERAKKKCGNCREEGHTRNKCPRL